MRRLPNAVCTVKTFEVLMNFDLLLIFNIWRNNLLVQTHFYFKLNLKTQCINKWVVV